MVFDESVFRAECVDVDWGLNFLSLPLKEHKKWLNLLIEMQRSCFNWRSGMYPST